jgi:hypothetical protein
MNLNNRLAGSATIGLILAAGTTGALAQTPKPTAESGKAPASSPGAPTTSATEEWIKNVKNPVSWMTWGGDLRLRNEYVNNMGTLGNQDPSTVPAAGQSNIRRHEQDFFRFRTRIWTTIKPATDFELNARVTTEPREWMKPSYQNAPPPGSEWSQRAPVTGWDWTEGIIDQLNVRWTNICGQPLCATVGRQDLMLGETLNWWLVADGTPLDGSRTFFLDSARLTYNIPDCKTTVEAIYIDQGAMNDRWLPPINGLDKPLVEQNERGAIFFVSNKSIRKTQLDAYFIYKHDDMKAIPNSDSGEIYTIGSKISGDIADNWKYSFEGAYQFGRKQFWVMAPTPYNNKTPYQDLQAGGINSYVKYLFKDSLNNQLRFSYEFLSGDDQTTAGTNEGFDLLWGRWPRWSELYIYSSESRAAQYANLHRFGPGWSISPTKKTTFSADYYALFSAETGPADATKYGTGNFRGHFIQAVLKHKFSPHVSGHLWSEFLFPGDYFAHHSMMTFLRAEMLLTF